MLRCRFGHHRQLHALISIVVCSIVLSWHSVTNKCSHRFTVSHWVPVSPHTFQGVAKFRPVGKVVDNWIRLQQAALKTVKLLDDLPIRTNCLRNSDPGLGLR